MIRLKVLQHPPRPSGFVVQPPPRPPDASSEDDCETEVVLRFMSARVCLQWQSTKPQKDLCVLAQACITVLARRLNVPQLFIRILPWSVTVANGMRRCEAQVTITDPEQDVDDQDLHAFLDMIDPNACIACFDTRRVYPGFTLDGWFSGYEACERCTPCDICHNCKVFVPDDSAMDGEYTLITFIPCCFICLIDDEEFYASELCGETHFLKSATAKARWSMLRRWWRRPWTHRQM
jgi:hypothetical protein